MLDSRWLRRLLVASAACAIAAWSPISDACGIGRYRSEGADTHRMELPYLAAENVVLVWDRDKKLEHFVREVRFADASGTFAFIVPTPSRPEVAKVGTLSFHTLRAGMPFEVDEASRRIGRGYGGGKGRAGGRGSEQTLPPPVEVLDEARVGSFTAFTLAAHDGDALGRWLVEQHIEVTPALQPWLARYVQLGFHFVVLRYEATSAGANEKPQLRSETVRISFPTPAPYYPYLEPAGAKLPNAYVRRLNLWYVSQEGAVPIARRAGATGAEMVRPWRAGERYKPSRTALASIFGKDLEAQLPEGNELVVQTFEDHKTRREGFQDVVMVPEVAQKLDEAALAERAGLMAAVDDGLFESPTSGATPPASPSVSTSAAPAPTAPASSPPVTSASTTSSPAGPSTSTRSGCAWGAFSARSQSESGLSFAIVFVAMGGLFGRRRWPLGWSVSLAALLAMACRGRESPSAAPAASAQATGSPASAAAAGSPATASVSAATSQVTAAAPASGSALSFAPIASTLPVDERARRRATLIALLDGSSPATKLEVAAQDPGSDWELPMVAKTPVQTVALGATNVIGKLPQPVVVRILAANLTRMRGCHAEGLRRDPDSEGTIVVRFTVSKSGSVENVSATGGSLADNTTRNCVASVVRSLSFPEPEDGSASVTQVLNLRSK